MKISIRQSESYDWQGQDTWAVEQGREQAALDLSGQRIYSKKTQTAQLNKKSMEASESREWEIGRWVGQGAQSQADQGVAVGTDTWN